MDNFLDAPFNFEDGSNRNGSGKNEPLSPGTLSRLEASWHDGSNTASTSNSNSSKPSSPVETRERKPRARSPTQPSQTGAHLRLPSFGDGLDADFSFFTSPQGGRNGSISSELQQSYLFGRNSLGLLDDNFLNLSPQAPSAPSMTHSQSASGELDRHNSNSNASGGDWNATAPRKQQQHQQQNQPFAMSSFGALGDSLHHFDSHGNPGLAFRNGSISGESYHAGTQHPSRHDFSLGQSPKSTRHSPATRLSFAQAGSPDTPSRPLAGLTLSPFDANNHATLLSLSQEGALRAGAGHRGSGDMGPPSSTQRSNPAMNLAKRGMFDSTANDSNKRRTSPQQRIVDASEEPTPLASSSSTFSGPRPNISPATPFTPRHQQQLSTPSSSFSSGSTTPDDGTSSMTRQISANGSNTSPFTPASTRSGSLGGGELTGSDGHAASFGEPLDRLWSKKDGSSPDKSGMPGTDYDGGNLSLFHRRVQHPGMTRMQSAPSLTPISVNSANQHQHRNGEASMPSTPSDCPPDSAVSWVSSIPSTPGDVTALGFHSPGGDSFYSSTSMAHSRSAGALNSMMSPPSIAPLTLHDGTPLQTPSRHRHSGSDASTSSYDYLNSPLGAPPKSLKKAGSVTPGGTAGYLGNTPKKSGGRSSSGAPPPLVVSSADKVHVCHCGKRFKRMEHLKRHNRTHTQERPHKCPMEGCGKYFGRTDNLAQHLKTHFRVNGLARASEHLMALTSSQQHHQQHFGGQGEGGQPIDLRHDPHAAAAHAAAAAMKAAAAAGNGKRRSSTISIPAGGVGVDEDVLGGPISLTKQGGHSHNGSEAYHQHQHGHFSSPQQHQQLGGSPFQGQHDYQQQGGRPVLTQSASANASPSNVFTTSGPSGMTTSPYQATM